MLSLL
ncbi:MAG: hypothetical protein QG666_988, partial [Euryarchaeota archaeon]|jgi:hypothetical protein